MSGLSEDIHFDLILPCVKAMNQKQAFQALAREISPLVSRSERTLYMRMSEKEKLASSGMGDGIAIPYIKLRRLEQPFTALATLENRIAFDSLDDQPVDIICLVLSPEREGPYNLRRLARISRLLKNRKLQEKLRETTDEQTMRSLLMDPEGWLLAA